MHVDLVAALRQMPLLLIRHQSIGLDIAKKNPPTWWIDGDHAELILFQACKTGKF